MDFLGTNFGHDAAAALIDSSGTLRAAVEEGRLIGKKDVAGFPENAIDAVLACSDGGPLIWSEGWNWPSRLRLKGVMAAARYGHRDSTLYSSRAAKEWGRFFDGRRHARARRATLGRPVFVGHHRAHALSLVPWGLPDRSLILVSDTTGERESVSSWYWAERSLKLLVRSDWPHSPGSILHQAAYHLGFPGQRGPGKLMALAAWGDADAAALPSGFCEVREGRFHVDLRLYPAFMRDGAWRSVPQRWASDGHQRIADLISASEGAGEQGADFAAVVQRWFEDVLIRLVDDSLAVAVARNLDVRGVGLSGGSALNCQANGRLVRHLAFRGVGEVTVSPWSNDAGTAIGAAVAAALAAGATPQIAPSALLGPFQNHRPSSDDLSVRAAANALVQGEIIGLVSGGVEFGPRALGARCLLADARRADAKKRLNDMKARPGFMPLAPALLREDAPQWFTGRPTSNMGWTVRYTEQAAARFPAMSHPSGETRAQAVTAATSPLLHSLLTATRRDGAAILLLTSLNGAGEPMLASADDSIRAAQALGASGCLGDEGWVNCG